MMPAYTIRRATPEDAEKTLGFLKALADEPHNGTQFESSDQITNTVDDEAHVLHRYSANLMALWLVALDTEHHIIGQLNASNGRSGGQPRLQHTITLGVSVASAWRNQGVGTALMRELMAWCESNKNVKRLELEVLSTNSRAIHVYEKLGFVHEGARRAVVLQDGRFVDLVQMAVLYERPNLEREA